MAAEVPAGGESPWCNAQLLVPSSRTFVPGVAVAARGCARGVLRRHGVGWNARCPEYAKAGGRGHAQLLSKRDMRELFPGRGLSRSGFVAG